MSTERKYRDYNSHVRAENSRIFKTEKSLHRVNKQINGLILVRAMRTLTFVRIGVLFSVSVPTAAAGNM